MDEFKEKIEELLHNVKKLHEENAQLIYDNNVLKLELDKLKNKNLSFKTIDDVCNNPRGTFQKQLKLNQIANEEAEEERSRRIKEKSKNKKVN